MECTLLGSLLLLNCLELFSVVVWELDLGASSTTLKCPHLGSKVGGLFLLRQSHFLLVLLNLNGMCVNELSASVVGNIGYMLLLIVNSV